MPEITQPNVYFGLGLTGYVVANTKQAEVDYQQGSTAIESHYKGSGGVQLSSLFTRAAFALAPGRPEPADLEPDHRQVAHHVRA